MTVFLGDYNLATDNGTEYTNQKADIVAAINTYGTGNIAGIIVGNEFILESVYPSSSFKCSDRGVDALLNLAIWKRAAGLTQIVQLATRVPQY